MSLSLNTSEYLEYFQSHLDDKLSKNRLLSAIAIAYLTVLYNPDKIEAVREQLFNLKDQQIKKGLLIGLGFGFNPKIHLSEIDEQVLGLLELTGETINIGFILIISTLL